MILASIVHFTACTSASHVKPLSESPQEFDPNQEEVSKLMLASEAYHEELKRKGLLYSDEETNTYVNRIGSKLAPPRTPILVGDRPGRAPLVRGWVRIARPSRLGPSQNWPIRLRPVQAVGAADKGQRSHQGVPRNTQSAAPRRCDSAAERCPSFRRSSHSEHGRNRHT